MFPGIEVTLAFVTNRDPDDPVFTTLREHGHVVAVPRVSGINSGVQAKFARYWVSANRPASEIVYIDDIDAIPIDRDWHLGKLAARKPMHMLMVGAEVYGGNEGQVPASHMTAEAAVWERLFKTRDCFTIADWYASLARPGFDLAAAQTPEQFSDEKLIAVLRREPDREIQESHVRRGYQPGEHTIDRSWDHRFSVGNLETGKYIASHMPRPYAMYREINDATFDYIRRRYGGASLPGPLVW
jgi:hypothetical protein